MIWRGIYGRLRQAAGGAGSDRHGADYHIAANPVIRSLRTRSNPRPRRLMALRDERQAQARGAGLSRRGHKRPCPTCRAVIGSSPRRPGRCPRHPASLQDSVSAPLLIGPCACKGENHGEEGQGRGAAGSIVRSRRRPSRVRGDHRGPGRRLDRGSVGVHDEIWCMRWPGAPSPSSPPSSRDRLNADRPRRHRRAPTPTGAAEMVVRVRLDLLATVA